MRVAFFDTIQEQHVVASLRRALEQRGHRVYETGRLASGFRFVEDASVLERIGEAIDQTAGFSPDLVLVFRPAALPIPMLQRLRSATEAHGTMLMPWFSDDPVLWQLSYGPVVNHYDMILHCGGEDVLQFYQQQFGRPTGVNMPFWTDSVAFRNVYGSQPAESDAVFLGNVGDRVRRERYFDLRSMGIDLRIHGKVGEDYFEMSGGYLDADLEVERVGATSRLAINIPQWFEDHRGHETWFEGLADFGSFSLPSRVVQCAAMGLPVLSLQRPGSAPPPLPEVVQATTVQDLADQARTLLDDGSLSERSRAIRARFESEYSAASRAQLLEAVREGTDWKSLTVADRAGWFRKFDGSEGDAALAAQPGAAVSDRIEFATRPGGVSTPGSSQRRLRIGMASTQFGSPFSSTAIAERALLSMGHKIVRIDLTKRRGFTEPDPEGVASGQLTWRGIRRPGRRPLDLLIVVGGQYLGPPEDGRAHCPVVLYDYPAREFSENDARAISRANLVTMVSASAVAEWQRRGVHNVRLVHDLADRALVEVVARREGGEATIVARRQGHLPPRERQLRWAADADATRRVITDDWGRKHSIDVAAGVAGRLVTHVLADPSRPGGMPHSLLPAVLASGSLTLLERDADRPDSLISGVNCLIGNDSREFAQKIRRIASDPDWADALLQNAAATAAEEFAAERVLEALVQEQAVAQEPRWR